MWSAVFRFEIRYQLGQPLFYLATFFLSVLLFASGTQNGVGRAVGRVYLNAPLVTIDLLTQWSLFGLFVGVAFVATAAVRDFDRRTSELFLSKPVTGTDYLLGRFAGGSLIGLLMFLIATVTLAVSTFMPGLDPELVGPFRASPYLFALGVMVGPSLFCVSAIAFALASWTRSLLATYLGLIGLFGANTLARIATSRLGGDRIGQLLDPFGSEALHGVVRYWTTSELNTLLPPVGGMLLVNRALWVGIGVAALVFALATFDRSRESVRNRRGSWSRISIRGRRSNAPGVEQPVARVTLPESCQEFSGRTVFLQFLRQVRLEVKTVFCSVPFLGILSLGLVIVVSRALSVDTLFGTGVYPVTHLMLESIEGGYAILLLFVAVIYSGEMIWRERSVGLSGLYDAAPVPNGVYLGGKLVALFCVMATYLVCGAIATIGVQIWRGHYDFEFRLYAQGVAMTALYPLLISVLACFFHIVARSKFIGYGLMIVFIVGWDLVGEGLGLEHHLYRFASLPIALYSDMNGYGHFLKPFVAFGLYWALGSVVLIGLSVVFWKRGSEALWKTRWAEARSRFHGPTRAVTLLAAVAFLGVGAWIFYNTNVLNDYTPSAEVVRRQAAYETKYRQFKDVSGPRIQEVRADVDLFPGERRVDIRGAYRVENEGADPIHELHISVPSRVEVRDFDLPPHEALLEDSELGYFLYRLEEPLLPGASAELGFDLRVEHPGFVNGGSNRSVVGNGSYLTNEDYFPVLGYSDRRELEDRGARRRHGLEPAHRMAKIDDEFARRNTPRGVDADWVKFETTVSTAADQVAIAPGSLAREWRDGDRRYFRYVADAPIPNHFAYFSGRYEVRKELWGDVAVEIYHHPGHDYNVDRMIESVQRSLDYFTQNFSPYPHRQVRVVEIPGYGFEARAFPNTIAFSESIGFIARVEEDSIDYPFYVASHELAHQWWSHQVIGGYVQGVAMLAETMAQYSALMVMEKEYGPAKMRRFLKLELDKYLSQRAAERDGELPLALVEKQDYIFYHKGSVAMYALKDYVGEERLNEAIRAYVSKVAFQEPPFTTTTELLDEIRQVMPVGSEHLIEDLFETITLFDNEAVLATYVEQPDGKFLVRLEAKARKLRADGQGVESEIPIDDWIDIAVFGAESEVLLLEKRHITDANVAFDLLVDKRPTRAGIDPYNKLVDRDSNDNVQRVSEL